MYHLATLMLRKAKAQKKTKYREHPHRASIRYHDHNVSLQLHKHPVHFQRQIPRHPARTMPGFDVPTKAGVKCTKAGYFPSSQNKFFPNSLGQILFGPI